MSQLAISSQKAQSQSLSFWNKLKIHKFKMLGGTLGVLVFAGAVFAGYKLGQREVRPGSKLIPTQTAIPTPITEVVVTPTSDSTANWETYTNTKYGYTIKYPSDFIYKTEISMGDGLTTPYYQEIFYKDSEQVRLSVMKILDMNQFKIENKTRDLEGASLSLANFEELIIDGQPAISYEITNKAGQTEAYIVEIILRQAGKYISLRQTGERK